MTVACALRLDRSDAGAAADAGAAEEEELVEGLSPSLRSGKSANRGKNTGTSPYGFATGQPSIQSKKVSAVTTYECDSDKDKRN